MGKTTFLRPIMLFKAMLKFFWLPVVSFLFLLSFDLKYDAAGLTFLISMAVNIFFLCYLQEKLHSVNLISIYYLFALIFLCLVPWLHYSADMYIWRSKPVDQWTYFFLNVVISFSGFLVFFSYLFGSTRVKKVGPADLKYNSYPPRNFLLVFISSLSFVILLYLNDFSFSQLMFRGVVDEARTVVVESSALSLILGMTSRLVPVFCFLYAITVGSSSRFLKILLFLIMFFSVFPTGVARYLVAFAYIPVFLVLFPVLRVSSVFSVFLIVTILFLFPFLDQFRYFSGWSDLNFIPSASFFYAAHFDAYENFASAFESKFVTYGYQLLGALLFFVPRAFWSEKPVGSGYEMANQLGYSFNNISMPFLAEGYVNFGLSGVLIFSITLGYSLSRLDGIFLRSTLIEKGISFSLAVYFYLVGALFFLLRGDLLSSTAFITAGLVSALVVRTLCRTV